MMWSRRDQLAIARRLHAAGLSTQKIADWMREQSNGRYSPHKSTVHRWVRNTEDGITAEDAPRGLAYPVPPGQESTPQDDDAVPITSTFTLGTPEKAWYDEATDTYHTVLKSAGGVVKVAGGVHRRLLEDYSNFDGQPATINQIRRRFGIPRPYLIEYFRVHGITHDRLPLTDEQVAKGDTNDLAKDLVARQRRAIHTRVDALGQKRIERDARRWMEFDHHVLDVVRTHIDDVGATYQIPRLRLREPAEPYYVVTSPTDFHWGMCSRPEESGYRYDRVEARRRLQVTTERLLNRLPGRPEAILCAYGSDFIHVDGVGPAAATTRGTPQHVDGTPLELMLSGLELQRQHIDMLAQVAPVRALTMPGNHDKASAHALLVYLRAVYENSERVHVVNDHRERVYTRIGDVLICWTHGDTCKTNKLGPVMANEARKDWGECPYRLAIGGHLHHERHRQIGGVFHWLLPSLAESDAWHSAEGYVAESPGMTAILISPTRGVIGTVHEVVPERERKVADRVHVMG